MKPFLDSGFLLTLLFETSGSSVAWDLVRKLPGSLHLASLQRLNVENRLVRQIEAPETPQREKAVAAAALQRFRHFMAEEVFVSVQLDYDIAILLASQWQGRLLGQTPPLLLL